MLFGLTGNIGCGKSTVAKLLSAYSDVSVFDTDKIAKNIIASLKYRGAIENILGVNNTQDVCVDFRKNAKIIFENPEKKKQFEELIHPLVWNVIQEEISTMNNNQIIVVESAIIYETYAENKFAGIIVATCNEPEQLRRLREVRKMDDSDIQARINQQLSSKEKERRAQFIIQTDCAMEELKIGVDNLYWQLKQRVGGIS